MAETTRGGRYQTASGQWVDAQGKPVAAPVDEAAAAKAAEEAAAKKAAEEAKAAEKKGK